MPEETTKNPAVNYKVYCRSRELGLRGYIDEHLFPCLACSVEIQRDGKTVTLEKIIAIPASTISGVILVGIGCGGDLFIDGGVTLGKTPKDIDFESFELDPQEVYLSNRLFSYSGEKNCTVSEYENKNRQVQLWMRISDAREVDWMQKYIPQIPERYGKD